MPFRVQFPRGAHAFLCLFLIGPSLARAQDPLTLERCVDLARATHPRARIAANTLQAAELSLAEVGKEGLPQISGLGMATYVPVPPRWGYDPAITDGGQLGAQVSLRQSIYDAGVRGLRTDQLRLEVDKAGREKSLSEAEITFSVTQAYGDVLQADEEVGIRLESLGQLTSYGDLIRKLHGGGAASYPDVLKADMQTAMASIALTRARESSAAARLSLGELIGIAVDSTARLVEPAEPSDTPTEVGDLEQTLEMTIAKLEMESSQVDVRIADHERFPVLSLAADAGYLTSGDNLRLPRADRLNTWGYSIGIGLEIPILNWGATGLRVQQKELVADGLRLRQEQLRRSLTSETRKTAMHLAQAGARLATLHRTIRQAEENFLLTRSKYAGGGGLALEVFAAQQLLTDAKLEEVQTRADIREQRARLVRLTAHEQSPVQP